MIAVVALALAASCGGDDSAGGDDAPYVVATTGIWADIAGLVDCDDSFDIRAIVPPGGDAHSYEPSLRDRGVLDGAALVVANGLALEELLDDTLDDVEADGVPIVRMADHVPDHLDSGDHDGHDHDSDDHDHGDHDSDDDHDDHGSDDDSHGHSHDSHTHDGDDPHVWFDPMRVAAALPVLGDALVDAGADRAAIDDCVTAAQATLADADAAVSELLAAIPVERRILVTNHDALGYFADRYDFTVLGTVLPSNSTLSQASAADLDDLGRAIEAAGVPAIFTETLHAGTDAEALARRLGVEVVELHTDALGEEGSGAETYVGLLTTDAEAIAAALGAD